MPLVAAVARAPRWLQPDAARRRGLAHPRAREPRRERGSRPRPTRRGGTAGDPRACSAPTRTVRSTPRSRRWRGCSPTSLPADAALLPHLAAGAYRELERRERSHELPAADWPTRRTRAFGRPRCGAPTSRFGRAGGTIAAHGPPRGAARARPARGLRLRRRLHRQPRLGQRARRGVRLLLAQRRARAAPPRRGRRAVPDRLHRGEPGRPGARREAARRVRERRGRQARSRRGTGGARRRRARARSPSSGTTSTTPPASAPSGSRSCPPTRGRRSSRSRAGCSAAPGGDGCVREFCDAVWEARR